MTPERPRNLSWKLHRQLIGVLGFLLPISVHVIAALRATEGRPAWLDTLSSVSAYYYTGAVGAFVGVLFALSLFLLTYQGYENEIADRIVGGIGGAAALGVVFFPTRAPSGFAPIPWWSDWQGRFHLLSATVLFGSFIVFSIWLFRRSSGTPTPEKKRRNAIYLSCGWTMTACVLWIAAAHLRSTGNPDIFLPEMIAIEAFALSWLVKGEAAGPMLRAIGLLEPLGTPDEKSAD